MAASEGYKLNLVLLLGSYDQNTKELLIQVKGGIADQYGGEGVYGILLDDTRAYYTGECFVIAEKWADGKWSISLYTHSDGSPIEEFDVSADDDKKLDLEIRTILRKTFGEVSIRKLTVLQKLEELLRISGLVVVVRDKEETRGGEVAELVYTILNGQGKKVCVFKKETVELSTMLREFLDLESVVMRPYKDSADLIRECLRHVSYRIQP